MLTSTAVKTKSPVSLLSLLILLSSFVFVDSRQAATGGYRRKAWQQTRWQYVFDFLKKHTTLLVILSILFESDVLAWTQGNQIFKF